MSLQRHVEDKNSTILVVDDLPFNLEVLQGILYREGYHVLTAPNAAEALAVIETKSTSCSWT